ncbi:MAG: hypothetical protein HYX52_00575 [Chloroflexi bacterium]|nr:hypothetical protein [Chloroflexota bacterium]
MPTNERVTITLPTDLVRDIDRLEKNRSRFIQDAARHELDRRRRELLQHSLRSPHPETAELADAGFEEWASSLPEEDAAGLVDLRAGTDVRWVPGEGWTQVRH